MGNRYPVDGPVAMDGEARRPSMLPVSHAVWLGAKKRIAVANVIAAVRSATLATLRTALSS